MIPPLLLPEVPARGHRGHRPPAHRRNQAGCRKCPLDELNLSVFDGRLWCLARPPQLGLPQAAVRWTAQSAQQPLDLALLHAAPYWPKRDSARLHNTSLRKFVRSFQASPAEQGNSVADLPARMACQGHTQARCIAHSVCLVPQRVRSARGRPAFAPPQVTGPLRTVAAWLARRLVRSAPLRLPLPHCARPTKHAQHIHIGIGGICGGSCAGGAARIRRR